MTRTDAASLAFKLMGIYAIIQAIPQVSKLTIYAHLSASGGAPRVVGLIGLFASIASISVLVALGLLLLGGSERFAQRSFGPAPEPAEHPAGISGRELQAIAFSAIGLAMAAAAFPDLSRAVFGVVLRQSGPGAPMPPYLAARLSPYALARMLQFLIGLLLFLGAPGLARIWHALRAAPTNPHEQSDAGRP